MSPTALGVTCLGARSEPHVPVPTDRAGVLWVHRSSLEKGMGGGFGVPLGSQPPAGTRG